MDPQHRFENPEAERVEGNWKIFVGFLREKWGDLTEDEEQKLKGQREQVLGYLQERTASGREELERDLDEVARRANYTW
jgi:uncharacterized protein YjbJ (UPF0337 family)